MLTSYWVREAISAWAVYTNHTQEMRRFLWVLPSRSSTLPFEMHGFLSLLVDRVIHVSERSEPIWPGFARHIVTCVIYWLQGSRPAPNVESHNPHPIVIVRELCVLA